MLKIKQVNLNKMESKLYSKAYSLIDNNNILGRCVLTKKIKGKYKNYYNLNNVIIYSKFRGKGYCSIMIKKVMNLYKKYNIYLEVNKKNIPAFKCYKKAGFKKLLEMKNIIIMIN